MISIGFDARSQPESRVRPPSRRRRGPRYALLVLVLSAAACAGGGPQQGVVSRDLGRGSRYDLDRAVDAILHQAGYNIRTRRETPANIYYETDWRTRKPFHEEAVGGAGEYRTRILVEAHRERANIYAVRLRAENVARVGDNDAWSPVATSNTLREHVEDIASAITMRIDSGVRTY